MRYLLSLLLLPVSLAPALAQDNEAEKLFRALEKKIKETDAIHIIAAIEFKAIPGREEESKFKGKVSKATGSLLLTKDNKARLKINGAMVGMEMVSNGKQVKLATEEGDVRSIDQVEALPTPNSLRSLLSTVLSRAGVMAGSMAITFSPGPEKTPVFLRPGNGDGKDFDPENLRWGVSDFKAGAAIQIDGRDAKVISYIWGPNDEKFANRLTLWVDAKTLLPLKRVIVIESQNLHITEMYSEFNLDPKIDVKAFELVPQVNDAEKLFRAVEEKIKAARAVHLTFDIESKGAGKGKEVKLKGSLLFTSDNKARLKMNVPEEGKDTIEVISDGKHMKLAYAPEEKIAKVEKEPTPKMLHSLLSSMVSGPGLLLTYDLLNFPAWITEDGLVPGTKIRARPPFRVTYFDFGATEKVGGRDAKAVTYSVLDLPGDDFNMTLWIDAETLLPVRRLIVTEGKNGAVRITENCTFNLNPKVEAGAFDLPK